MSLITRCPACGTMFKVVPDQLRISDGWVRCGHCGEVFDAHAHMHDPNARQAEPEPAPPAAFEASQQPEYQPVHESQYEPPQESAFEPMPGHAVALQPPPEAAAPIEVPHGADPFEAVPDLLLDDSDLVSADPLSSPAPRPAASRDVDGDTDADEPAPMPAFVKQANRKAFWRRPLVRALLGLVLLMAFAALALQAAVFERDRVAAYWPAARPVLEQVCVVFKCRIGALRKIESVVIDGDSFTRLRPDVFRLNITLKNNAAVDVAMPAIELTLVDTQDQAVVRRVLQPADMGAADTLAAGAEWGGSVPIAVSAAAGNGRVAGYRVLAFYP